MPVMLDRWNDPKMDALAAKVDDLGGQMREQRREMEAGFKRIDDRRIKRMDQILNGLIGASLLLMIVFYTLLLVRA
jgi:hypothetical protein